MFDPNTTIMIHESMIKEELQRSHPDNILAYTEREPGRGPIAIARTVTSRALLALGSRIAPSIEARSDPGTSKPNPARRSRRLGAL